MEKLLPLNFARNFIAAYCSRTRIVTITPEGLELEMLRISGATNTRRRMVNGGRFLSTASPLKHDSDRRNAAQFNTQCLMILDGNVSAALMYN